MVDISVIAKFQPAIVMVLGFLLIISGWSSNNQDLVNVGTWAIIGGVFLQVLWIFKNRFS